MYLAPVKQEISEAPSEFCMLLRKKLSQCRIEVIAQVSSERIVRMDFSGKEQSFILYLELFGKGNVVLCNQENKIISCLHTQTLADRTIRGGIIYQYPQKPINIFEISLETFSHVTIQGTISKTLALGMGLGGLYAEELCKRAKVDVKATQLTKKDWKNLYDSLQKLLKEKVQGFIVKEKDEIVDVVPYKLCVYENKTFQECPTFNDALFQASAFHVKKIIVKPSDKKLLKIQNIIDSQREQIPQLENEAQQLQRVGELIYEHYQQVQHILTGLKEARKSMSWKDIKTKLKNPLIVSLDENHGKITLELGK